MLKQILVPAWLTLALTAGALWSTGCRSTYYAAMEKFGYEKRDLLKKRVVAARDGQVAASEQFKDALTRLKEITGFKGGDLEKTYDRLKADFDRSETKAKAVRTRVRDVETVAADLFREWEAEIGQMSSAALRSASQEQLRGTRRRYDDMHAALKRAEAGMDPVLAKFRDQVLFLKHNLNAQAIASLKGESAGIQKEIAQLIEEMNASIAQADKFIQTLP